MNMAMNSSLTRRVWIVFPVYNEGTELMELVSTVSLMMADKPHVLLLIDDGSTDNAVQAVENARLEDVQVIRHPVNRGLGAALKTGLEAVIHHASFNEQDVVIVMDADMTHPPLLILRMIERLEEECDVAIASRFVPGAGVKGVTLMRQILSHGASWVFRIFLPVPNVRDYTCSYRAYRASILTRAFEFYKEGFVTETGFSCMADVLLKLHRLGARFCEVPLRLRYDQKRSISKMKVLATIGLSLRLIGRHWPGSPRR